MSLPRISARSFAVLALLIFASAAMAQERTGRGAADHGRRPEQSQQTDSGPNNESAPPNVPRGGVLALLPSDAVTEHSVDTANGKLSYTATAGTFPLFDQTGAPSAKIFYTAFVAKSDNPSARPVTFVFNGGPGAASAFLNLGLVGPRIATFGTDGRDGSQVRLVDNPDTWLAFTDL